MAKKINSSIRRVSLMLLAVVLVAIPVLGIACGDEKTEAGFQKMSLKMNNAMPQTDLTGIAADKFKELLELYTSGNVTIDVYHNGSLYEIAEEFEAVTTGSVDLAPTHPVMLGFVDPKLDIMGGIDYLIMANREYGSNVETDPVIKQALADEYAKYKMRFLGYIDTSDVAIFLSNDKLTDYADLNGKKYLVWAPGPADPVASLFGAQAVFVPQTDIPYAVMNGQIQVVPFGVVQAYESTFYKMFKYGLVRFQYTPGAIEMNLDTWNKMEPALQELISNKVMPEVQEYIKGVSLERHKKALLGLKEGLSLSVISMDKQQEVWEMLQTRPDFLARKNAMDPAVVARMYSLRPAKPTMDQEIIDMFKEAGIRS